MEEAETTVTASVTASEEAMQQCMFQPEGAGMWNAYYTA